MSRSLFVLLGFGALAVAIGQGCSAETLPVDDDGASQGGAAAGAGGAHQGGDGGAGGVVGPCGQDCGAIATPQCYESVCNEGQHPGPVGQCVVVPVDGGTCDDGAFCTTNDTCSGGVCVGGPPNDCGLRPGACDEVVCNESTDSCDLVAVANGAPCTSDDLCQVGTTCIGGACGGGTTKDCFFAPVPNECHVAVCNPTNGDCEPEPGNDGESCTDLSDLCTVGKTCASGSCTGGSPKDCSIMTQGCNVGICDTASGNCTPMPVGEGMACDDLNPCTTGEICTSGTCGGGTPVSQCIGGDLCCPMGCTEANDTDCGCTINLATSAVGSHSGGGSGQYGPTNWNDGLTQQDSCNQGWISNGTTPNGKWMQYEWPGPVVVGSFFIDGSLCSDICYSGRTLGTATVQWWNGSAWVTAGTINNPGGGDVAFVFSPQVTTTRIRLFDVTALPSCGTSINTLAYEWYVWTGTNCSP